MIKYFTLSLLCFGLFFLSCNNTATEPVVEKNVDLVFDTLSIDQALSIARMSLHCISQEYPNKTGHTASSDADILKTPKQLHPSFYGCFDWHSSVHGHWMLVRILNQYPNIPSKDSIVSVLSQSLSAENLKQELAYFNQNILGNSFERTYGWAWLLKLDQELKMSSLPEINVLEENIQPLVTKIVDLWKVYLSKETYPNRTGVHNNTAFGLRLALDWAKYNKNAAFEQLIKEKAIVFFKDNIEIPAHLEPNGSDFFSPSLYAADLMSQILNVDEFNTWLAKYYTEKGLARICELPKVSDRNDYQIVHLDGLMFSRVVNMRSILPLLQNDTWKTQMYTAQNELLQTGLKHLSESNYGGEHWLGSFAVLALSGY